MKRIAPFLLFLCSFISLAQEEKPEKYFSLDASYYYGTILEHNPDIAHLITDHPNGILLSLNRKTYGLEKWERRYNYPDYGFSFIYQDLKNTYLGENYSMYGHFSFYFIKRLLMIRIGQGVAYTTNPYDADTNYFNNAFGTRFLSSTYLMGNLQKENIIGGLGINAGITVIHYSNADTGSPNHSTNTFTFNVGLNYTLDHENHPDYILREENEKYTEPVRYNFAVRSGFNTAGVVGSPKLPFLTLAAYADKVINHKSTLQAGTELFFSRSMEEFINYQASAFPSKGTRGDEDAKRIGVFLGHKLTFNKMALITQLGYYAYYPYTDYVEQVYNRMGLERKITDDWWASVTVRSHGANAEAVEFSIGYRL
ncbi:acyloxyacyl hydrolase [Christiangramia sabulilitoris]|uniref:Acyloxyacyl hydrolase n=1 Tax=Christiangramia sabulilitoris TaxID=2583991 RepID=A0A550HZD2_9FLAO|nr:acyloxyacyl hydrolase [Christiangramia sabulilitoris]TRO64086.1 acyloxyacyl hydrolase [Christiangramia sabulilitoris]